MAWEVTFREDQGLVRVVVSGEAAREEHLAAREAAVRLLGERQCQRLLVDLRSLQIGGEISTVGCYDFGANYSQPGRIPPAIRVAHILPDNRRAAKDVEFTTAVATNRGATIRNFESEEEARAWLRTSSEVSS